VTQYGGIEYGGLPVKCFAEEGAAFGQAGRLSALVAAVAVWQGIKSWREDECC
jgi:hypothetical protein